MNGADIGMYYRWAELAKNLGGRRQPTADELITAQVDAYRTAYRLKPHGFNDENEFQTWLGGLERAARGKESTYLRAALPVYNSITQKLAKSLLLFY